MPGGMGGGQSSTTNETSVQTKTPYAPAVPGLQRALTDADTLYSSGIGGQVYGGQRVAGFNDDTTAGIIGTRDQAASDNAGAQGVSYLQNLLGSNGISATTQQGLGMLANVPNVDTSKLSGLASRLADPNSGVNITANALMSGARDINTEGDLRGLLGRALAPSSAETNLSDVASGKYLSGGNPYVEDFIKRSADDANNAVAQKYAASGRYGSGNFSGALAKATGDIATSTRMQEYDSERTRQAQAAGQIDSARQAGTQLGQGILGDIGNVQGQNNQFRLAGAGLAQGQTAQEAGVLGQVLGGDQFNSTLGVQKAQGFIGAGQQGTNAALQAAGLLPQTDALRYAPAQQLMGIGNIQENKYQQGLDALQQQFQEQQQTPWQLLSQYSAFPTSIAGLGGTTVTNGTKKTEQSGVGGLQGIIGGLSSGASLLGKLGGLAGGSGLLGSIGSFAPLLMGSDERMKENIQEVGELHDGQKVHAYNYRGDPRTQIGLLAGEVEKRVPEAVGPIGLGDLLGVDYGKATSKAAAMAERDGDRSGDKPRRPVVREAMGGPGLLEMTVGSDPAKGPRPGGQVGLGHLLAILAPQEPAPIVTRGKAKAPASQRKAA